MDLLPILQSAGETSALEAVARGWEESQASFPEGGGPLLSAEAVAESAGFAGFGLEHGAWLVDAARRVKAVPGLDRVLWHCFRTVFFGQGQADLKGWPSWQNALGDAGGAFYLLVGLGGVPEVRAAHRKRGIPEDVTRDTCRQARSFSENHERGHGGKPGIYISQITWLRHYVHEPYYRLGRLEFWLSAFGGDVHVYRHRREGHVLALAEDGKTFNHEGYVDGSAGKWDAEGGWVASFSETETEAVGFPYFPAGMAVRRKVRLPLADWEPVLAKGTWALDMHIPAGGSMGPDACLAAHRKALEFFDRHHPENRWAAIVCDSWIFNTQLDGILPADANMVRYQRDLYLHPVRSSGQDGLWFIFLQEQPLDLKTAPRESHLQKAILQFLEAGNTWRGGAMFILREHAGLIGRQHYRTNWPAALAAAGND
ncbi:MAG: acyltransferase domain-containing protein [Planctomycetota bacterium]